MLRLFVLLLLLANGLYFAWTNGYLQDFGFAPATQSEPQRVTHQIRPADIQILSSGDAKKLEAQIKSDAAPKECMSAGPFDQTQTAALKKALESWPEASWQLRDVEVAERWILYMGKYASVAHQQKKRAELEGMGIKSEIVRNPELEPGLSLGVYTKQAEATAQLSYFAKRGVKNARVVKESDAYKGSMLRLPAVSESIAARLGEIKPALAGATLKACN